MDEVRDVCSATLSVRKAHGRRVRQPLATLTVAVPDAGAAGAVHGHHRRRGQRARGQLTEDVAAVAGQVLQVVPASIGPRLGKHTQDVIRAVKAGDWELVGDRVVAGGHWLEPGEFTLTLVADGERPSTTLGGGTGVIVLDVDVTPELEQEGRARDLIRLVQQARRDADLAVTDRIELDDHGRRRLDRRRRRPPRPDRGGDAGRRRRLDATGTDTPEIAVRRARVSVARRLAARCATIESAVRSQAWEVRTAWPRRRRRPPSSRRRRWRRRPRRRRQDRARRRPPPRRPPTERQERHPDGIPAPRGTTKEGIVYTKDFDVKFLKAQHDALLAERQALLGQANRLEDEANSLIEDGEMGDVQFDDESGEGDTMVVERERDLALSAQARQTIADIDAALERMTPERTATRSCPGSRSRASAWRRSRGRRCSSRRRSAASAAGRRRLAEPSVPPIA